MKEIARYGSTLGLICLLAGGLLAGVNSLTQPRISAQAKEEEQKTLSEVLPQAGRFEAIKSSDEGKVIYYKAYDKTDKLIGVAFKAEGKGYSSVIETIAGMGLNGRICGIKIVHQEETPGLGGRVAEVFFTGRFSGKSPDDLSKIEAITGATISSKAVIDSVIAKAEEIKALIKDF